MNTALWIITGLLTAIYLFSGFGKLFVPREKMAAMADAARWVGIGARIVHAFATGSYSALFCAPTSPRM